MFFTRIELHNFGIYKGTHRIELSKAQDKRNITLIGGMNGRGKTTILDAIFLTFFGKRALPYIHEGKSSYNQLLRDYINKSATDDCTFVSVAFVAEGGDEFKVTRSWSADDKTVSEKLNVLKNHHEDVYLSENWNYYIEDVIPLGISRFFFFDNEKISQIADDESFQKIKESIKIVLGVSTIDKLLLDVQKIGKEKKTSAQTIETSSLMAEKAANEDAILSVEAEISKKKLELSSIVPQLEQAKASLDLTEESFWKQGGHLGVSREEIEKEKLKLKAEENSLKQEILDLAVNSATPLIMCTDLVRQVYNEAKLAQMQTTLNNSKPIIDEILERLTQRVTELFKGDCKLQSRVTQLITDEINNYKIDVGTQQEIGLTPVSIMLIERLIEGVGIDTQKAAHNLAKQVEDTENALLQIDIHLSSNAEKSGALELLNIIRDLERAVGAHAVEISKIEEDIAALNHHKLGLENERQKIIRRIAQIDDAADDDARIINYVAKTEAVMAEFRHRLQMKKVSELERNIMECFKQLAQKESIITSVEIDPKSLDITLKGYDGGVLLKSQLSAGEKQMFAISIIWGLALSSGYKLPVVIDTPMARLDSAHRHNFINHYLPNASTQVIVLSTDEEVYGRYLYQIQEHINSYYTLCYNEDEKCTVITPGYFEEVAH